MKEFPSSKHEVGNILPTSFLTDVEDKDVKTLKMCLDLQTDLADMVPFVVRIQSSGVVMPLTEKENTEEKIVIVDDISEASEEMEEVEGFSIL